LGKANAAGSMILHSIATMHPFDMIGAALAANSLPMPDATSSKSKSETWLTHLTPASAAKTAGAAPAQAGDVTGGFVCCKLWLGAYARCQTTGEAQRGAPQ